jgi:23S rRNA pseudouridine955/2504/2580 synthase
MSERLRYVERRAGPDDAGRRLDKVLRSFLGELPLSAVYRAMRTKRVLVNGAPAQADYRVLAGDVLAFDPRLLPSAARESSPKSSYPSGGLATLGDLLLLATADLLFLNKPRGMLVHGDDSLEERVRASLAERSGASLSFSPGPLHRLDRNSSGLVVFPRSSAGARSFTALLRERRIVKLYLALVEGRQENDELWADRIERDTALRTSSVSETGESARSRARPLATSVDYSLVLVELQTGLTHQIRVQAASRAHPLAGDRKYGGHPFPGGYILHALALRFPTPPFADVPAAIVAPLPPSANSRLNMLFGADFMGKVLESSIDA